MGHLTFTPTLPSNSRQLVMTHRDHNSNNINSRVGGGGGDINVSATDEDSGGGAGCGENKNLENDDRLDVFSRLLKQAELRRRQRLDASSK